MISKAKSVMRWGLPISLLSLGSKVFAQSTSTTTPGVPTTALGGDWVMNSILIVMGIIAIGVAYAILRNRKAA